MLKFIARGLVVSGLLLAAGSGVSALTLGGGGAAGTENAYSPIDDARVFCFNRFTGRFLHWGSCARSAPRVYCRNRWNGRFLHWGAC